MLSTEPRLSVVRDGGEIVVCLRGSWRLRDGLPSAEDLELALGTSPVPRRVRVEANGLERWDSSLVVVVERIEKACTDRGIDLDLGRVPLGARRLLEIARGALPAGPREPGADAIGVTSMAWARWIEERLDFLGLTSLALLRTLAGRTRRLGPGLTVSVQDAGAGTLALLAFIALMGGGVLALLASQQLDRLGASLLAPHLVAIVIVRELGALATGMALAGRMGSANAAELATMVADEEVEALRTVGVDPFDLLVAPRILALVLMGPLLVLYANAFGLLGSVIVGVGLMDVPAADHIEGTRAALSLTHAMTGLFKGAVFGLVVGLAACYHGLGSGRDPGAVGRAVKAAVVTAILGVVAADAALTLFFRWVRF